MRTLSGDVVIEVYPKGAIDASTRETSLRALTALLYDFTRRDSDVRRVLLDVLETLRGRDSSRDLDLDPGSAGADTVARQLRSAAWSGSLVVRRADRREVVFPVQPEEAEVVLGPEPDDQKQAETTWIAIELVGEDGKPVPGEAYRITLPDGSVREGTLDNVGKVMIRGIDAGQCSVTFPRLDQTTWGPAGG